MDSIHPILSHLRLTHTWTWTISLDRSAWTQLAPPVGVEHDIFCNFTFSLSQSFEEAEHPSVWASRFAMTIAFSPSQLSSHLCLTFISCTPRTEIVVKQIHLEIYLVYACSVGNIPRHERGNNLLRRIFYFFCTKHRYTYDLWADN